jgi:hypothetical protein
LHGVVSVSIHKQAILAHARRALLAFILASQGNGAIQELSRKRNRPWLELTAMFLETISSGVKYIMPKIAPAARVMGVSTMNRNLVREQYLTAC